MMADLVFNESKLILKVPDGQQLTWLWLLLLQLALGRLKKNVLV